MRNAYPHSEATWLNIVLVFEFACATGKIARAFRWLLPVGCALVAMPSASNRPVGVKCRDDACIMSVHGASQSLGTVGLGAEIPSSLRPTTAPGVFGKLKHRLNGFNGRPRRWRALACAA